MPNASELRAAYLERLAAQLPMPSDERASVLEEIDAHVTAAARDLESRGIPPEAAERRALERLGPPDWLARDLAAAHRTPTNLLEAAGTAVRITLIVGFKTLVASYAIAFTILFASGVVYSVLRRWTGIDLGITWGPTWEAPLVAGAGGITAYAIGRLLPAAVSVAARRPMEQVRWAIGGLGAVLAVWIGLFAVDARWTPPGAVLMSLLPVWFVLGVVRPGLLPRWFPGSGRAIIVVMLMVAVASLGLFYATGGSGSPGGAQAEAWDPDGLVSPIGPIAASLERPLVESGAINAGGSYRGADPVSWSIDGQLAAGATLMGWSDLHLEVWPSSADAEGPSPPVGRAIATGQLIAVADSVSGYVTFLPRPDAGGYYVALLGRDPDGTRMQLGWPQWEQWTWAGSVWQFFSAQVAAKS